MTLPFLKWAGGKRRLLPLLLPLLRAERGRYHEPFLGGGAVFFGLAPAAATLGDANARLVATYEAVRDDVEGVLEVLSTLVYDKAVYLDARRSLDEGTTAERAARFIYVNKAGFNGLYRVNAKGQFNVPFGRYANPTICDADGLRAASKALRGVEIRHEPFERVLERAVRGDVVYLDPPYLPISATSSFTGYTEGGFRLADHRRLRDVALELAGRGARVVLSNSAAPAIRDLYGDGFAVTEITAARSINSRPDGRAPIAELVITAVAAAAELEVAS